jgi:hypothetical protein
MSNAKEDVMNSHTLIARRLDSTRFDSTRLDSTHHDENERKNRKHCKR